MWSYIGRRLLYTPLIVLGVLLVTFVLFKLVPGDVAAMRAGKNATRETIEAYRVKLGLNKPLFINPAAAKERGVAGFFDSQFFDHFTRALTLNFGNSAS